MRSNTTRDGSITPRPRLQCLRDGSCPDHSPGEPLTPRTQRDLEDPPQDSSIFRLETPRHPPALTLHVSVPLPRLLVPDVLLVFLPTYTYTPTSPRPPSLAPLPVSHCRLSLRYVLLLSGGPGDDLGRRETDLDPDWEGPGTAWEGGRPT